jgi:hypothetical protein
VVAAGEQLGADDAGRILGLPEVKDDLAVSIDEIVGMPQGDDFILLGADIDARHPPPGGLALAISQVQVRAKTAIIWLA